MNNDAMTLNWASQNAVRYYMQIIVMDRQPNLADENQNYIGKVLYEGNTTRTAVPISVADLKIGKYLKVKIGAFGAKNTTATPDSWTVAIIQLNSGYEESLALEYATKYNGRHPDPGAYNPNYSSYSGDCTNFVSQCLFAGGMMPSNTWRAGSSAWIGTGPFIRYFANTVGKSTYIRFNVDNKTELKVNNPAGRAISIANIHPGDVIFTYGSSVLGGGYEYGHAMFVVRVAGNKVFYSAHTADRCGCMDCGDWISVDSINVVINM